MTERKNGFIKTETTLMKITNAILTYGGYIGIVALWLFMLNTSFVFETQRIHVTIRLCETANCFMMLIFYTAYIREIYKVIRQKRFLCHEKQAVELEKKYLHIKVDVLFSGLICYAILIVIMRGVSWCSITYAYLLREHHAQTLILGMLHSIYFFIPMALWNRKEIGKLHLQQLSNIRVFQTQTA